jgi:hypothetical protein
MPTRSLPWPRCALVMAFILSGLAHAQLTHCTAASSSDLYKILSMT